MKYKLVIESPAISHILDTKENRIVALCTTKRPDLGFYKLEELVSLANESERSKLEIEQHRNQNPVFYDGGRNEDIHVLQEENKQLKQWINDLQSGMYVNCVYCGHRYGLEGKTPTSMADILKEHIENCPNHPMSELKKQNKELKRIIAKNNNLEILELINTMNFIDDDSDGENCSAVLVEDIKANREILYKIGFNDEYIERENLIEDEEYINIAPIAFKYCNWWDGKQFTFKD